jgi:hypothetical protein
MRSLDALGTSGFSPYLDILLVALDSLGVFGFSLCSPGYARWVLSALRVAEPRSGAMMHMRWILVGKMRTMMTSLGIHLRMGTTVGTTVGMVGTSWICTIYFLRGCF